MTGAKGTEPTSVRRERAGEEPQRTCVGTRAVMPQSSLLRVVLVPREFSPWASVPRAVAEGGAGEQGETIALDVRRKAPGRGAWLSPSVEAVVAALKRGGFARAFKRRLMLPEQEELLAAVEAHLEDRVREGLHLARRAGAVALGETNVAMSVKAGACRLLLLAEDISEGNRRKFTTNADRKEIEVKTALSAEALGGLFGMPQCAAISIEAEPFASRLRERVDQWRNFRSGLAVVQMK